MITYYEVEHYGKVKQFDDKDKAISFAMALERVGYTAKVREIKITTTIIYPNAQICH